MDPLTSFSLAASVLQVIGFSIKVIEICRELHKNGSLSQYEDSKKVIDTLGMYCCGAVIFLQGFRKWYLRLGEILCISFGFAFTTAILRTYLALNSAFPPLQIPSHLDNKLFVVLNFPNFHYPKPGNRVLSE